MIATTKEIIHWVPNNLRDGDGRNDALFRAGCWMQERGFDDDKINSELEKKNAALAEPLDKYELTRIKKQVLKYRKGLDSMSRNLFELWKSGKVPVTRDDSENQMVVTGFREIETIPKSAYEGCLVMTDAVVKGDLFYIHFNADRQLLNFSDTRYITEAVKRCPFGAPGRSHPRSDG
jgi:hypothetical protein